MSFDPIKYNYPQIARDSGFKLRQFRDGPLDWRLVGSLEVERILREQQFEHIDAILFHLSEAPLASMLESNILDSGIAKYFILSQLAIQYLIFCRKFLDETVRTLRESLVKIEVENVNLKKINQEHSKEILQLHKKISQIEAINDIVFPCHMCTKNFVSNDALNIHLHKKHSKSSLGDIPGKANDKTLINTIKLELEIKQLKERLNLAEKDIRDTVETKKCSPREVPKICSSTQINTITNDIGTQSNLFERKESDCTEDEQINKLEILSQLQQKISKLESWQETQNNGNQQSINEITQKLSEITESLQSRAEQDADNFRALAKEAILSSLTSKEIVPTTSADELQQIISNTVSEVLFLNSEKLNEVLAKIERIYAEKLPSLEEEIERGKLIAQEQIREAIATTFNLTTLPLHVASQFEGKESFTSNSFRTYSLERPAYEEQSEGISTNLSEDVLDSEENDKENISTSNHSEPHLRIEAIQKKQKKILAKKMASCGLNSNVKSITTSEAAKISAKLAERRNSLQNVYPRLYATRNKLKKLVDRLSSKKVIERKLPSVSPPVINKLSSKKTNIENSRKVKPKSNFSEPSSKIEAESDAFKKRLEKILSSPIEKPAIYIPCRMKELVKPIPMPRKRVMFSNPDDASTGDEVSLSQKDLKKSITMDR